MKAKRLNPRLENEILRQQFHTLICDRMEVSELNYRLEDTIKQLQEEVDRLKSILYGHHED
jgi:hypothetical protein